MSTYCTIILMCLHLHANNIISKLHIFTGFKFKFLTWTTNYIGNNYHVVSKVSLQVVNFLN